MAKEYSINGRSVADFIEAIADKIDNLETEFSERDSRILLITYDMKNCNRSKEEFDNELQDNNVRRAVITGLMEEIEARFLSESSYAYLTVLTAEEFYNQVFAFISENCDNFWVINLNEDHEGFSNEDIDYLDEGNDISDFLDNHLPL